MSATASSPWAVLVESRSADERALRVEAAELRARLAERDRSIVLLTDENGALRDRLDRMAEQLAELQRRLDLNSRNSSKPPSSDGLAKPAPRSRREVTDRRPGGQPGHEGRTLHQVSDPDERVVHSPAACGGCGSSLAGAPVTSTETRQVFDLPEVTLRVVEHVLEHRRCGCGQTTMAPVPVGAGAPVQYGPGLRGVATYLLAAQHLPLARTAELLTELFGATVSEGTLATWYAAAASALQPFEQAMADRLAEEDVLGADETGARVAGALAWIHALRTDRLTLYSVSARRGVEAMTDAGVLPRLGAGTVLVHDFWAPYWNFDVTHAVCGAHLLRELAAAAEIDGQASWSDAIDRLLCEINRTTIAAREAGAHTLSPRLLAGYRRRYDELITAGWAANPDHSPGGSGKRRRPKHVNLLDRLDGHRDEVLRFAADLRVPFTNNGSEQDVRPVKIRMKVAGCLRTMAGAEAFCRLRSYLSTARKQGQPGFIAMRMLADGSPWMPTAPPSHK